MTTNTDPILAALGGSIPAARKIIAAARHPGGFSATGLDKRAAICDLALRALYAMERPAGGDDAKLRKLRADLESCIPAIQALHDKFLPGGLFASNKDAAMRIVEETTRISQLYGIFAKIDRLLSEPAPASDGRTGSCADSSFREGALQGSPTRMTQADRRDVDALKKRAFDEASAIEEPTPHEWCDQIIGVVARSRERTVPSEPIRLDMEEIVCDRSELERAAKWLRASMADMLAVAQQVGIVHEADGHTPVAGPTPAILRSIAQLKRDANEVDRLRAAGLSLRAECERLATELGEERELRAAAEKARNHNAIAAAMLEKWRERRKRCLDGVAPTLAEIQSAMPEWTNVQVMQDKAPAGSAMRHAVDAGAKVIDMLWKHSEALRERCDFEMAQRDEISEAYRGAVDQIDTLTRERDAARADQAAMAKCFVDRLAALPAEKPAAPHCTESPLSSRTCEQGTQACDVVHANHPEPPDGSTADAEGRIAEIANRVARDVAEIHDRVSPADWPEAMIVTDSELRSIVSEAVRELAADNAEAEQRITELEREAGELRDRLHMRGREMDAVAASPAYAEVEARITKARGCLTYVCGHQNYTLTASVPAKPEDDDIVIADGLDAGMDAVAEASRLRAQVDRLHYCLKCESDAHIDERTRLREESAKSQAEVERLTNLLDDTSNEAATLRDDLEAAQQRQQNAEGIAAQLSVRCERAEGEAKVARAKLAEAEAARNDVAVRALGQVRTSATWTTAAGKHCLLVDLKEFDELADTLRAAKPDAGDAAHDGDEVAAAFENAANEMANADHNDTAALLRMMAGRRALRGGAK